MTFIDFCAYMEWPGYVIAILGAVGCALPSYKLRFIGFVLSIIADIIWGMFGYSVHASALVCLQFTYACVCLVGLWNNRGKS